MGSDPRHTWWLSSSRATSPTVNLVPGSSAAVVRRRMALIRSNISSTLNGLVM